MSEWTPRHRRRVPGAAGLYVLVGAALLLVVGSLWAVATLFARDGPVDAAPRTEVSAEPVEQSATPGEPVGEVEGRYRIWIPVIGLTAPVVEIESSDRVLLPPEDPMLAGWWSQGVSPDDDHGSALVIGHAMDSGDAVFNELRSLDRGDMVMVNGDVLHAYRVSDVSVLDRAQLAERAEDLFNQEGPPHLVLVTCDEWDGDDFQSNVVVIAERV